MSTDPLTLTSAPGCGLRARCRGGQPVVTTPTRAGGPGAVLPGVARDDHSTTVAHTQCDHASV